MVDIIDSSYLPEIRSTQQAELITLTWACQLAKEQITNIYNNSHYAFGVGHDFWVLRKQRGFLTFSRQSENYG